MAAAVISALAIIIAINYQNVGFCEMADSILIGLAGVAIGIAFPSLTVALILLVLGVAITPPAADAACG